jgi:hypothetical protein
MDNIYGDRRFKTSINFTNVRATSDNQLSLRQNFATGK